MSELKPCPFCGGKMRLVYSSIIERFVFGHVDPRNCYFSSFEIMRWPSDAPQGSLAAAKEAWNRRAEQ